MAKLVKSKRDRRLERDELLVRLQAVTRAKFTAVPRVEVVQEIESGRVVLIGLDRLRTIVERLERQCRPPATTEVEG